MLYNSYEFLFLFLPLTLGVFFFLSSKEKKTWSLGWLVVTSLAFYSWWNPRFLLLILFSMGFNYAAGLLIERARKQGKPTLQKAVLGAGVAVNLSLIAYFKYADFVIETLNALAGSDFPLVHVLLPLAISFFTFQQIAYLVDVSRAETEEHSFLQYCLFVTFFPQLIAGPIVHHEEMLPQFKRGKLGFSPEDFSVGITVFIAGLFKKVVVADQLALYASPVFAAAEQGSVPGLFSSWEATLAYSLQLYFDFSGYSDMAIGLGRMFGIKIPQNFNSPYRAVNMIEFWRRWHMTLSRFLRDYLYIPLGGNQRGKARRYLNLMITMVLGGLWHGAGWTFVIWGGLHGLYLVANHAWRALAPRRVDTWWSLAAGRLTTFIFVALAWVFFRAESMEGARAMFTGMVSFTHAWESAETISIVRCALLWAMIVVMWYVPNTQQWLDRFEPAYGLHETEHDYLPARGAAVERFYEKLRWAPTPRWALWSGVLACAALLSLTRISEFLYFRF